MSMFQQAALFLNDDMYHEFKIALALGHWRNGDALTPHQRKICQEVVSIREAYSFEQPETEHLMQQLDAPKQTAKFTDETWLKEAFVPSQTRQ